MKKYIFIALYLSTTGCILAQNNQKVEQLDSVVIDSKNSKARKNSGKIIAKISSETLERSAGKSVAEVINEVSGIEINGSRSNDGQNLGLFVRGGRNRQVVILIDGVQLNDPSFISNDYDLRLIPASSIESIEILKGASSVLYGSGAGTAVISIISKNPSQELISGTFTSTLGTNGAAGDEDHDLEAFTNDVAISGTLKKFNYRTSFSNRYVEGLSAVAAPEGEENFMEDVFNRFDGNIHLGYEISDHIKISRFFNFDKLKTEFDDFSYFDADYRTISDQLRTGGHFEWKFNKGNFTINDNYSWLERETISLFPTKFDARSYSFDAYLNYEVVKGMDLLAGINGNFSNFDAFNVPFGETEFVQTIDREQANFDIIDPYINVVYLTDFGLNINAGVRLNNHSDYGTHFVYHANPSFVIPFGNNNLKLLTSYSTAYITPSLFQLYEPSFGNVELEPEENSTLEGGMEFTSGSQLRISVVYFNRKEENFVDFVLVDPELFIYQYRNVSEEFQTSGVEVEVSAAINNKLNAAANYTYIKADERFSLRIPEHKANVSLNYTPSAKSFIGIGYSYTGERQDSFFNSDTFETEHITLSSFGLLNVDASYQMTSVLKIFMNLSNLLDEEYEELYRFQTRGRNFRVGFLLEL